LNYGGKVMHCRVSVMNKKKLFLLGDA